MAAIRLVGLFAALGLTCAPSATIAQSCMELTIQHDQVIRRFVQIAADYPLTHGMIALCFSDDRNTQQQKNECANNALRTACFFMGEEDCNALLARWRDAVERMGRIEQAMRARGC